MVTGVVPNRQQQQNLVFVLIASIFGTFKWEAFIIQRNNYKFITYNAFF